VLHVLNGDAVLPAVQAARLPGDLAVWRDMLSEGPAPGALEGQEHWALRARVLAQVYGIPDREYLHSVQERWSVLDAMPDHDEVVLWFDDDLFCQVNLSFLLAGIAPMWLEIGRVSLVAARSHPRSGDAKAAFAARQLLGSREVAAGTAFWEAYGSADPQGLGSLLATGLRSWPWLGRGLAGHLDRFPSPRDGLSAPERAALVALARGPKPFLDLFPIVSADPAVARMGLGDLQLAALLTDLAREPAPLLRIQGERGALVAGAWKAWTLRLTPECDRVLRGEVDAVPLRGIDRWLGGVHLQGRACWRWDPGARRLAMA
jgi:hypothetical protein